MSTALPPKINVILHSKMTKKISEKHTDVRNKVAPNVGRHFVTYVGVLFSPPTYDSASSYLGVVSS